MIFRALWYLIVGEPKSIRDFRTLLHRVYTHHNLDEAELVAPFRALSKRDREYARAVWPNISAVVGRYPTSG